MKNVAVEHNHRQMPEMMSLEGRGAVVTGGARGIGAEIALRLSEAVAQVALLDLDARQAEHTAREIEAESGQRVLARHVDVREAADVFRAAAWAEEELPELSIWVNNAGIFPSEDPAEVPVSDFARVIDTNLLGTQLGTEAAVEAMRRQSGGVIVNVAGSPGFHPAGSYAASSWAIQGLTKGLAGYLGPEQIRVVCVAPTIIETPGFHDQNGHERQAARELQKNTPLPGHARPDDVARAVHFLVSDAASFVTGVTLPVDGGESVQPVRSFQPGPKS